MARPALPAGYRWSLANTGRGKLVKLNLVDAATGAIVTSEVVELDTDHPVFDVPATRMIEEVAEHASRKLIEAAETAAKWKHSLCGTD